MPDASEHDDAAVPQQVSKGYLVAMDEDAEETFEWPENPGCFIKAKRASVKGEDRIAGAAMHVDVGGGQQGAMRFGPNAAFIQKCIEQITDFAAPVTLKKEASVLRFDRNAKRNADFYEKLCQSEMRGEIEGWLDEVGGRDIPTQRDLSDLGEGPSS